MKNLKKFENLFNPINKIKRSFAVNAYLNDNKNFPKMDDVRSISEDLSDWCYLNVYKRPNFANKIIRNENEKFNMHKFTLTDQKFISITDELDTIIKSRVYYITYQINFTYGIFKNNKQKEEFGELLNITEQRLSNFGFTVIYRKKSIGYHPCVFAIDKNDPITLKEILER